MITYEIITSEYNEKVLKRNNEDGTTSWIPLDESNSDYQAYLNKDKPQVEHLTEIIPADEAKTK